MGFSVRSGAGGVAQLFSESGGLPSATRRRGAISPLYQILKQNPPPKAAAAAGAGAPANSQTANISKRALDGEADNERRPNSGTSTAASSEQAKQMHRLCRRPPLLGAQQRQAKTEGE